MLFLIGLLKLEIGCYFDERLTFDSHINYIISNALRKLYYILRITKDFKDIDAMCALYTALVRSNLLYASQVWSPYYDNVISRIESVQHKFFRQLSYRLGCGMMYYDHDYRRLSQLTGICSLESFRDYLDILYLYKIIYDFVDSKYLFSSIKLNTVTKNLRFPRPFDVELDRSNFMNKSFIFRSCNLVKSSKDIIFIFDHKIIKFKNELRNIMFKFE